MHRLYWPSFCCTATLLRLCFTVSRESCRDPGSGRKSICFWALHKITRFKLANHLESTWGQVSLGIKSLNPGSLDLDQARQEKWGSHVGWLHPSFAHIRRDPVSVMHYLAYFWSVIIPIVHLILRRTKIGHGWNLKWQRAHLEWCVMVERTLYAQKTTA